LLVNSFKVEFTIQALLLDADGQLFTGTHESLAKPELCFSDTSEPVPNQREAVEFEGGGKWPPPIVNGACSFRCQVNTLSRDCGSRTFTLKVGTAKNTVESVRTAPFSCVNFSLSFVRPPDAPGWCASNPLTWYNQMVRKTHK
jgi:hypothetical protein